MIALSGLSYAQNAYVTGNTKVKVEPNTLVYFGQNFELTSAVTGDATVENAGNIKIDGNYVNGYTGAGNNNGKNFTSSWALSNYGQVIIKESSAAGYLAMQKGTIDPSSFPWGQFAMPFAYSDAEDAMQRLFDTSYTNSTRYKMPMMVWDNTQDPEFDDLTSSSTISPLSYVILNLSYAGAGILDPMDNNTFLTYRGMPTNGTYSTGNMSNNFRDGITWPNWKETKNSHNEKFKTYLDDPFRNDSDNDFAKFIYQYGNPYTSNIYLANIGRNTESVDDGVYISNLMGVSKYTNLAWQELTGVAVANSAFYKASFNGTVWAGDAEALIIRPFESFQISLNDNTASSMDFSDKLKTFSSTIGPDGGNATKNSNINTSIPTYGVTGESIGNSFYQLRLKLYDTNGNYTGNKVSVAVEPSIENGVSNVFEAEYNSFGNGTGLYLGQERADGDHVLFSDRKMDINAINNNFVGKAIPLFFNRADDDNNNYIVKGELFKESIFNRVSDSDVNFNDGNTFLFYDSKTDQLLTVDTNFSYVIEPESITGSRVRYELYWNEGPSDRGEMGTQDQLAGATIIYKDIDKHFVEFNKNWTNADVKVYDMSGRSISSYLNVDTKNKLALDLPARGAYVVKIVSNTGEVYTQKIIK